MALEIDRPRFSHLVIVAVDQPLTVRVLLHLLKGSTTKSSGKSSVKKCTRVRIELKGQAQILISTRLRWRRNSPELLFEQSIQVQRAQDPRLRAAPHFKCLLTLVTTLKSSNSRSCGTLRQAQCQFRAPIQDSICSLGRKYPGVARCSLEECSKEERPAH